MSSFRVGKECITRCVTGIIQTEHSNWRHLADGKTIAARLGIALQEMNIAALVARYGVDGLDIDEQHISFTFYRFSDAAPAAILKALDCLLYQCAEGDIPETSPLYERLKRAAEAWRKLHGVKRRSSDYETAAWGD